MPSKCQDTVPGREHAGKGKAALLCPSVKHFPAVVVISHVTQAHRRKARNSGPARGTGHRCIHSKKQNQHQGYGPSDRGSQSCLHPILSALITRTE